MLTKFDDYPIHQTPDPINTPATSDKDVYERYWFNGYTRSGDTFIAISTALYPHLGIQDCGISVVRDGEQHAFHASCRATPEPSDLTIGPYRLQVVEPMRSMRVTLDDNDTDFACDMVFEGRTSCIEEPRHTFGRGIRRTMDTTRFTQFGQWSGWLRYNGKTIQFDADEMLGTKDRSWGLRPLAGGDHRGAAQETTGGLFFLWAPLHFGDFCSHYQLFEDDRGRPLFSVGAHLPVYDAAEDLPGIEDDCVVEMGGLRHDLTFDEGSRMVERASLAFTETTGGTLHEFELERMFTFRMKGIGYSHPEWGHGMWKGDLAMTSESWALADIDVTAYENQHVQHIVRAQMGDKIGVGVLEQVILGPYSPYGLTGLMAPAEQ